MSFAYKYHQNSFFRPQSVHTWRQTDCASQAYNYFKHDNNFFKPEISLQCSDDFTTGYCAEEFPLIFYFVGILYSIFGFHEYIFRIFSLVLFFIGLFFLYKFTFKILKNYFWSFFLTFLLFTSPVFNFYANNFVTNIQAFSITLVGWFFFFNYCQNKKIIQFVLSIFFFLMAALLKISELFSLFTVAGLLFLELTKFIKFKENELIFNKKYLSILIVLFSFIIVATWYVFAHYYNIAHNQQYYIFRTGSIFSLSKEKIQTVWEAIKTIHYYRYYNKTVLLLLLISLIWNFINIRKANKILISITSIVFIGFIMYSLLFFEYFKDHDYYTISLYLLPIFSFITSFDILLNKYSNLTNSIIFKFLILLYFVFLVGYASKKIHERYYGWENSTYEKYHNLYEIEPYLVKIGITENDKIISIPDGTPNISLYLMGRKGYSNFLGDNKRVISLGIEKGAKYLIVNDEETLKDEFVQQYTYHQIGYFKGVSIYKLDGIKSEPIVKKIITKKISWDLETVSDDGKYFISDTLNQKCEANGLSSLKAFSGKNSVRLPKEGFSLKYRVDSVFKDYSYEIKIKRYSNTPCEAVIVAVISTPNEFYLSAKEPISKNENGWDELCLVYKVPENLNNKVMEVYVWNVNCSEAYFDDLSIIEKKTVINEQIY